MDLIKLPIISNEYFVIYFENCLYNKTQELIVVHCDILKWNKTVRNRLLKESNELFIKQKKPLVVIHNLEDKKHLKFIVLMGFIPCLSEVSIKDGSKHMLFIWSNL